MTKTEFKEWRLLQKLTQEKAAQKLGVTLTTVCNYERGRNLIPKPIELLIKEWSNK